jgi:hypothetical protein
MPATLDPAWALICMDQWRSDCAIKSGLNSALNSYAKVCRLCATRSEGQRSDFSQPRTAGNVRSLALWARSSVWDRRIQIVPVIGNGHGIR